MHEALEARRIEFEVPENLKQDLTDIDRKYHSDEIRKRGIARKEEMEKKAGKAKSKGKAKANP
jgi:predicted GNAT family acetyltransferase